jgi:hypothetical protein
MIFSNNLNIRFKERIHDLLAFFRDKLNVTSFNFGLVTPPIGPTRESWTDFPCIARIVDRGPYEMRFSDVGSFELFGATMAVSDPFRLARKIKDNPG